MVVIHTVAFACYLLSITLYNVIYYSTSDDKDDNLIVDNIDFMFWTMSCILLFGVQIVIIYIFWGLSQDEWIEFEEKETFEGTDEVENDHSPTLTIENIDEVLTVSRNMSGLLPVSETCSDFQLKTPNKDATGTESYKSQSMISRT